MKKILAITAVLSMLLAFSACASKNDANETTGTAAGSDTTVTESATETTGAETLPSDVMSHEDFMKAELESKVTVMAAVQATQSWWEKDGQGVITVYAQAEDGAYFLYEMKCSKEDAAKLTKGTMIKVTGFKAEWSGEVEIVDATFEIINGSYNASAADVTAMLGNEEELIKHQNELVSFKGMTVESMEEGKDTAFFYKWDNSGKEGDDLYFKVSVDGKTYQFTVESYLCNKDSDVYKAVKNLKVGDKIDMEGFLYWYNGVNPHITSVAAAK